jgi:hypothetical protein
LLIICSFVGIINNSAGTSFYFAQAALLLPAVYYLLKSDFFASRKYSFVFAVLSGLGAITKRQFPVFLIFLIIAVFILAWQRKRKLSYSNIFFAGLIFLLSGPLYFTLFQVGNYFKIKPEMTVVPSLVMYLSNFLSYFEVLAWSSSWVAVIIFIIGFFYFFKNKDEKFVPVYLSLLGSLTVFSLLMIPDSHKNDYVLAFLPFIATSCGFLCAKIKKYSWVLLVMIFLSSSYRLLIDWEDIYFHYRSVSQSNIIHALEKMGIKSGKAKLSIVDDSSNRLCGFETTVLLMDKGYKNINFGNEVVLDRKEFSSNDCDILMYVAGNHENEGNFLREEEMIDFSKKFILTYSDFLKSDDYYVFIYHKKTD